MIVEPTLVDQIKARVMDASAAGTPIEYTTGPSADHRAKCALGLPSTHKSIICAGIKYAIALGAVRTEMVGTGTVWERTKQYPVVALLPA